MTTANTEFSDLMPHRILVTGKGVGTDDFGAPINQDSPREYMCLLDDTTTTKRDAGGTEIVVALTAYVAPVPVGSITGDPVDIGSEESVKVINPYEREMTLNGVERHYDSESGSGMLHNIVLRFS